MHKKRFQTDRTRTTILLLAILLSALLVAGCSGLTKLVQKAKEVKTIRPSGVSITETREVSGFTTLEIQTVGKFILTQGDSESLTLSGSDNLVPLIVTQVNDGVLVIRTEEPIVVTSANPDGLPANVLTFEITLTDLTKLAVSGLASIEMDALSTSELEVTMSGAGSLQIGDLRAEGIDISVSGLGSVEIAGQVTRQTISIPGAGQVKNADLECETADVTVPGLGTATIWVTGELTGKIGGGGSVRYYGSPTTDTETTGLGRFEALGSK